MVQVAPDGSAVLAGRAAPGAQVTVRDRGRALGVVEADRHGEWVLVPDRPLPAGGQALTLSAKLADQPAVTGEAPVVLAMPGGGRPGPHEQTASATAPLAVLAPTGAAPRLLQAPPSATSRAGRQARARHGRLRRQGRDPLHRHRAARRAVRLYVDNVPVGDARADARGQWTLTPPRAGRGRRARHPGGPARRRRAVVGRVELPFQRVMLPPARLGGGRGDRAARPEPVAHRARTPTAPACATP